MCGMSPATDQDMWRQSFLYSSSYSCMRRRLPVSPLHRVPDNWPTVETHSKLCRAFLRYYGIFSGAGSSHVFSGVCWIFGKVCRGFLGCMQLINSFNIYECESLDASAECRFLTPKLIFRYIKPDTVLKRTWSCLLLFCPAGDGCPRGLKRSAIIS